MTNTYQPLECNTDILMIGKDTFTVERFKELVVEKVRKSFSRSSITVRKGKNTMQPIPDVSLFDALWNMNYFGVRIVDNSSVALSLKNIELISPPEGIECKILKLGNSEWQTGKLRIKLMFINDSDLDIGVVKLELCYD